MQPTLDVRRHNDGSIDFDFYRRRATRRRQLVRRLVFKHYLSVGGRITSASVSTIANLWIILSRRRNGRELMRIDVMGVAVSGQR